MLRVLPFLLLCGCISTHNPAPKDTLPSRSKDLQDRIDDLTEKAEDNKKWQKIYIQEIKSAKENQDYDAYRFFLHEFINTPTLILPDWAYE